MLFRKKPIEVEAFQMTKERRSDNSEWPNWLHYAWTKDWKRIGSLFIRPEHNPDKLYLAIRTLEGPLNVAWNDWIIRGVEGELYPCKPSIFEQTYEPVNEEIESCQKM